MAPGRDELTYVGHATVLIELAGMRLLTDPLVRGDILHVRRQVPSRRSLSSGSSMRS